MLQDLIETLQHAQRAIKENSQLEVEVKSLEEQVNSLKDEKKTLTEELASKESELNELEENPNFEESFLGLDTLKWTLTNGNFVIQQQMEDFIHSIQKQNAVVPA
jgi:uncharacterized protein YlxW (UPF0749 family)